MKGNKETLISAQEKLQSNSQTEFPNFWRFSKMAQDLNRQWIEFKLYKHSKHRTCQCHCDNSHGIVWSMKRPVPHTSLGKHTGTHKVWRHVEAGEAQVQVPPAGPEFVSLFLFCFFFFFVAEEHNVGKLFCVSVVLSPSFLCRNHVFPINMRDWSRSAELTTSVQSETKWGHQTFWHESSEFCGSIEPEPHTHTHTKILSQLTLYSLFTSVVYKTGNCSKAEERQMNVQTERERYLFS